MGETSLEKWKEVGLSPDLLFLIGTVFLIASLIVLNLFVWIRPHTIMKTDGKSKVSLLHSGLATILAMALFLTCFMLGVWISVGKLKGSLGVFFVKVVGVIPARFASTRFPGKPIKPILSKPLLTWVIERSQKSKLISEIIVATDDERIAKIARNSGVEVVMTDPELPSGSDRVWKAIENKPCDIVLNIQGDEPLIEAEALDALVQSMIDDPKIELSTLGRPMTDEALHSLNTAKILLNHNDEAIYFSRFPLPYSRGDQGVTQYASLKHIGIYCYRKSFLGVFCSQKPVPIEVAEGLEQLRALYLGAKIKVVRTEYESWGVDTPEDVIKVEAKLRSLGF